MKKDNLHFSFRSVDSHNKAFNFIISEREPGKSTALWGKAFRIWRRKHRPTIVLRRLINDITETYINDIGTVINKFRKKDKQIELTFKKGNIKEGIVDVFINDILFLRVIALSNPMSRIKSLIIRNPGMIAFDEFICNNRMGEKYLPEEAFKFKEIYNTYQRECDGYTLKCYFCGNPYSVYNPYFSWLNVDTLKLKRGCFIVGKNWLVNAYEMKPELRAKILAKNPLYEFDDAYAKYAFDGQAVNDANFDIEVKQPEGYYLKHVFRINHRYLGIYKGEDGYWISIIDYAGKKKIFAVDFDNLIHNTQLITTDTRITLYNMKQAIGRRRVTYSSIEAAYLAEEIYDMC